MSASGTKGKTLYSLFLSIILIFLEKSKRKIKLRKSKRLTIRILKMNHHSEGIGLQLMRFLFGITMDLLIQVSQIT